MEVEDDMIVLVVVDDDEENTTTTQPEIKIKTEPEYSAEGGLQVDDIIETAERHGEHIPVKIEPDDYGFDYLNDDEVVQLLLESERNQDSTEDFDNSQGYSPDDDTYVPEYNKATDKHRFTMLKPSQQRSFVAELRQEYPELRDDEELLVYTLEQIMRSSKPPQPPRDYYIMTGIMLECVKCGTLSDSIPAASRHYQEKHGQRYLLCYACGVDFRSSSNLYKHEKRCVAPDARLVLRARAASLGRKGRSRPYLQRHAMATPDKITFPCQLCSAVFRTRRNLQSHENLHRGERPFRCHACPCAYTSHSALSRHSMKHTDVQFICDHCSRSFKLKAALVSHMDTHKPMRKFACGECSRRFAQKCALQLHVHRVHRRLPPPCACQICPKRYPRMSLLKAHMKREHGMSIITRKMFFKSLPTMTELEIKQSKVVLKSEDVKIEYEADPLNFEAEEMFIPNVERDIEYIEGKKSTYYQELQDANPNIDEFMQCVTNSSRSLGYIQGLVIDQGQGNLILKVEAMVDGEDAIDSIKTEDEAESFRVSSNFL